MIHTYTTEMKSQERSAQLIGAKIVHYSDNQVEKHILVFSYQ